MKLKKITASIVAAVFAVTNYAQASVDGHLDSMFNALAPNSNVTDPSAYMTARRGVISGGSIETRNRIITPNIISMTPPSFNAGCNGVSLHGGALSFINGEEFQNNLRAIAANAGGLLSGYVFNMALKAMCEDCATTIQDLANKINQVGRALRNSCDAAKALTAAAPKMLDGWGDSIQSSLGITAQNKGLASDALKGMNSFMGDIVTALTPAEKKKWFGNVVWKALSDNSMNSWFLYGSASNDSSVLEMIMSLTGTIVISEPESGSPDKFDITTHPATINIDFFMKGGTADFLNCDDIDNCGSPSVTQVTGVPGFRDRIRTMLYGDGTNIGVIEKFRTTNDAQLFNETEKAFLAAMRPQIAGLLAENANRRDAVSAMESHLVDVLAARMTAEYVGQVLQSFEHVLDGKTEMGAEFLKDRIKVLRGQLPQLVAEANAQMQNMQVALATNVEVKRRLKAQLYGDK